MVSVPEAASGWTLSHRLTRVLIAATVVVIVLIGFSIVMLVQVRQQQKQVINRYFNAVGLSNQRITDELDAETATRGYALTGDAVTLQPYRAVQSTAFDGELTRLRQLIGNDPLSQSSLIGWENAFHAWQQQSAQPLLHAVAAHGSRAVTTAQVLRGKTLFDANRSAFSAFSARLVAKRDSASVALRLRTTLLFVAVLVATLGVAASGIALWTGLRRWVLSPLTSLGAEARTVRSGAMDHRVVVSGAREFTDLAADIDDMRREIVDQLAQVQQARLLIEQAQADLEAQAAELARSNRDLEQFAYVASHDLQEPLRKVASFCQMLERRYAGQLDERADTYIAFAVDGAKRMQQLINDLLAFSRVGRASTGFDDVDLQGCLDTALSNLALSIETTGAVVTSDPMPHVMGARTLLVQLFQNLIGNAIKFHGDAAPAVHVGAVRQDDDVWELSCRDNGIGIDPHYAERIFVIFQRLHGKDEYTGTGIGLALCKRIVEHHGGRIWLDTTTSIGTTFRWTLPVVGTPVRDTGAAVAAAVTTSEEPG